MKNRLRIGITAGDINGIGPEVALKSLYQKRWPPGVRFVLVGNHESLARTARKLKLPIPAEAGGNDRARVTVWDPAPDLKPAWRPGKSTEDASTAAAAWIRAAARACMDGDFDAMVTAPISKEGFTRAGIKVPGHTEYLAQLTGTRRYAMMLFGKSLRVVIVTRHDPIAAVPKLLTRKKIAEHIQLTAESLPWLGCRRRRIAVCGLNPHAGEGGTIGREEIRVIRPAIESVRLPGIRVDGPLPADTVFHAAAGGDYDAVVAMYHDQGLAPLKLLAFDSGVNITLGLPIVRTSPDHGTAFAIAGKGVARPTSMTAAIRTAVDVASRRNPWRPA